MSLLHNAPAQPMCRSCVRVSFECGSVFVSRAARQALALLRACMVLAVCRSCAASFEEKSCIMRASLPLPHAPPS